MCAMAWIWRRLQSHFQSIQRISDSTTLPSVLPHLKSRLFELVNLSSLTEKLMSAKGDPQTLSSKEKLSLWQELKVMSMYAILPSFRPVSLDFVWLYRVFYYVHQLQNTEWRNPSLWCFADEWQILFIARLWSQKAFLQILLFFGMVKTLLYYSLFCALTSKSWVVMSLQIFVTVRGCCVFTTVGQN